MSRLDQLVEHLYSHPDAELVLESNTTGAYRSPTAPALPVFRQLLRTGEILLLFADLVPQDQSPSLLAGEPVQFRYAAARGPLDVFMELKGSSIVVCVKLATPRAAPASPSQLPALLAELPARRASHLHLAPGQPAFVRVDGQLVPLPEFGAFSQAQIREALGALAPPAQRELVMTQPRFGFTHVAQKSVFQVHAQEHRGGLSVVVRCLPSAVPGLASLGVPPDLVEGLRGTGLWVLAGGPGQGTSTSLAALTQAVLAARPVSVYAVESSIEYLLSPGRGLVQQLEVGTHVETVAAALVEARAVDADLTVVGELGDAEALGAAIRLADRGRLVLGAIRARSAVGAVQKLLALTSPSLQAQLGAVLRGVFAQQLVPTCSGGRALAWELLPGSDAVRTLVAANSTASLATLRSHTLEMRLRELVLGGEVEAEVALSACPDRAWLERELGRSVRPRAA